MSFIHVNRIVPIHPLTDGLSGARDARLVWRALERFETQIEEPTINWIENFSPPRERRSNEIHFPNELRT